MRASRTPQQINDDDQAAVTELETTAEPVPSDRAPGAAEDRQAAPSPAPRSGPNNSAAPPGAQGTLPSLNLPRGRLRSQRRAGFDLWAARIGNGLLLASLVFAGFVAYAFAAPATYRSSALVWVDVPQGASTLTLTEPLEAARKLHHTVIDKDAVERLSFEYGPTSAAGQAETANRLRSGFEVHTIDGRAFSIAFRDSDRFRAQRVTAQLAERASTALPAVLAPQGGVDGQRENARQKHVEELMNFIAAHPEITAPPAQASTDAAKGQDKTKAKSWRAVFASDPAVTALYKERTRVETRLKAVSAQSAAERSENPYQEDDIWGNERKLRRRLSEIDRTLEGRRNALARSASVPAPAQASDAAAAELKAEWQRLLEAVKSPAPASTPATSALSAKIIKAAEVPRWPIDPNRPLLLWVGALLGLLCGAFVTLRPRPKVPVQGRVTRSPRSPWPIAMPSPAARRYVPPIARSLPLPYGRDAADSAVPLALVRPLGGGHSEGARNIPIIGRRESLGREQRRNTARAPNAAARQDADVAATIPVTRGEERRPDSRPRHTLMFGSVDGPMEAVKPERDRSMAITLRFTETGVVDNDGSEEQSRVLEADYGRPLPIVPHELEGWLPPGHLAIAARRPLASELALVSAEGCLVVGVVGSPQDGKSRIAAELALALSEQNRGQVLLLEGDFGRPSLHQMMQVKMPRSFGFSRQLEALEQGRLRPGWTVVRVNRALDVLTEGVMRTPGMVVGPRVARSVEQFKHHYSFIVIDGPSLRDASGCRALDAIVNGTVFVHSRERAAELSRSAALFEKKQFSWTIAID